MASRISRLKQFTVASVVGVGLAVLGVAAPAQAADPVGAVTYSNFTTSQVGQNFTVDFDYALVDPAVPGTIELELVHNSTCLSAMASTYVIPVNGSGHYHGATLLSTSNRSSMSISATDGVQLVYQDTHYQFDSTQPTVLSATIVQNADPSTGAVLIELGNQRYAESFEFEIDGVSVQTGVQFSCAIAKGPFPYSGVAAGSTLKVFAVEGHVELASFTNGVAAPVDPPVDPQVNPLTGQAAPTAMEPTDSLAHTGPISAPFVLVGGILTLLGVGFVIYANRRRHTLSQEAL